ncbi:hypothetical protein [Streptomyces thermolilacinus]|uniref:hypothetical protein n=1 Tax=Streptomyces thermolilacinus TaxID=285540 RepID=UPI0033F7310C
MSPASLAPGTRVIDTARMKVATIAGPPDRGGWYPLTGVYVDASWKARAPTLVPLPLPRGENLLGG